MNSNKRFAIFLSLLALFGAALVWLATSSYGPGLSTDGVHYLSTAESLAAGRGIIDYLGQPLTSWPPLYPLILAAGGLLTGVDVFPIAQWTNILAFGAIITLGGLLFARSLPGNWTFAVIASLILAAALPSVEVSANVASDPLFMVLVFLFLLAAQAFLRQPRRALWWAMAILGLAAFFLRYAGLTLIASAGLMILWVWRSQWKRAVLEGAAFSLVTGLPLAAWVLLYTLPNSGTLLGAHQPALAGVNFLLLFEKMAGWFIPVSWANGLIALVVVLALAAALLAASDAARRSAWWEHLQSAEIFPSLVFLAVYSTVMVFSISTSEHQPAGSQRLHVVLLPMVLILFGAALQDLLPRLPAKMAGISLRWVLLAGFTLWLLLPAYRLTTYVRISLQEGEASYYNLYNTRTLRQSDIVAELGTLQLADADKVYSNNEAAAWFFLRRRIYRLPRYDTELGQDLDTAMLTFGGWPAADELATLVWFERQLDYKEQVPTPDEMQEYIRLTPTFIGRYGNIYLMDVD